MCAGGGHGSRLLDQHHTGCPQVPLHAPGRVCPRAQPLPFIQMGAGKRCPGWALWPRPSCKEPQALSQEQCHEVRSCAACEAPSPRLLTPTTRMGSTRARRACRAKDCVGGPQLRTGGGLLPSQALSTCSSPLSKELSQDPRPAPSPILLLWMPFRQTAAAPVLTRLDCTAAPRCLLLGDAGWATVSGVAGEGGGMTQTCPGARAGKRHCCSYSPKGRRNWACCRTALGEGNSFSELHLRLSWLSCHLPPVPLQKELNIPGYRVCCDPSTTQGSRPSRVCRKPSPCSA